MGIKVASLQGAFDKNINAVNVAPEQGSIAKAVEKGYAAPDQGEITKVFYTVSASSGEILQSIWGGLVAYGITEQAASIATAIKPTSISLECKARAYPSWATEVNVYFEVQYSSDGVNYTSLGVQYDSYIDPGYTYVQTKTWTMDGNTPVKYIKYIINGNRNYDGSTGISIDTNGIVGKCTAWWG